jgi:predicted metalloprotease with PDZ domain
LNLVDTVGMTVSRADGVVSDVAMGTPADKAGISPGMKIVAVNKRAWSADSVDDALRAHAPIELLVDNNGLMKTLTVDYREGLRYPHLVRNNSVPDVLGDIVKPKTGSAPPQ